MAFKLTPEAAARVAERRAWHEEQKARFANLSDDNLRTTAEFYMSMMEPVAFPPGDPVYDATMWHVILPELIRRLPASSE